MDHGSDATIVEYEPYEVGPHIIKIVHEDAHIVGSPFTCNVYDSHKVTSKHVICNVTVKTNFKIDFAAMELLVIPTFS